MWFRVWTWVRSGAESPSRVPRMPTSWLAPQIRWAIFTGAGMKPNTKNVSLFWMRAPFKTEFEHFIYLQKSLALSCQRYWRICKTLLGTWCKMKSTTRRWAVDHWSDWLSRTWQTSRTAIRISPLNVCGGCERRSPTWKSCSTQPDRWDALPDLSRKMAKICSRPARTPKTRPALAH